MPEPKLVFIEDRQRIERRTAEAIYAERYRGGGPPSCRVGKRIAWLEADYLAWLQSRVETPAAS